jgi:hypothetical protein
VCLSVRRSGMLNRYEFMDMCISHLWEISLEQLEAAATNYAEFRLSRARRLNAKWIRRAKQIDLQARLFFPATYVRRPLATCDT